MAGLTASNQQTHFCNLILLKAKTPPWDIVSHVWQCMVAQYARNRNSLSWGAQVAENVETWWFWPVYEQQFDVLQQPDIDTHLPHKQWHIWILCVHHSFFIVKPYSHNKYGSIWSLQKNAACGELFSDIWLPAQVWAAARGLCNVA